MKHILGLDLGTNSIGWAVVKASSDANEKEHVDGIVAAGSRIIPMDAAILGDFDKGNAQSQTAERTRYRGVRRIHERALLRRERLHRVLDLLHFLPPHYAAALDRYGKFLTPEGCKIAWTKSEEENYTFLFKDSFEEMMNDFRLHQSLQEGQKVPYDWTLYYLRKKALTQQIRKEELAWILLSFNQKRGYYQLRGEEEEEEKSTTTRQYFDRRVIRSIEDTGQTYKKLKVLRVTLDNGETGKIFKHEIPDWAGQEKSIIATVDLNKDGTDRLEEDGSVSRRYSIPTEAEWDTKWALVKMKTQRDLDEQHTTVGAYIYDTLLHTPGQKIRGKLVRTIERSYYKDEITQILTSQVRFHPELQDAALYEQCIQALYGHNDAFRHSIEGRGFVYLFVDNILFYQRKLKSKKSLIEDCAYEYTTFKTPEGEEQRIPLKGIAKSHPLFQEFRLRNFVANLRIYQKEERDPLTGALRTDINVTDRLLPDLAAREALFVWLNDKKEVDQKDLLKYPAFNLKKTAANYRWCYVEDRKYPCNETHALFLSAFRKAGIPADALTPELEEALWHILYSITDKQELDKALRSFTAKHSLPEALAEALSHTPPFHRDYGSYSAKALKKLLPLLRQGVQLSDACQAVYGRHSQARDAQKWRTPDDIDEYLRHFRQHSLHNPIVEQVITETLRTVRDIWRQVGHIDEIHIELGREMKNPAQKRAQMTRQALENENTNLRIKALLTAFMNPEFDVENVRPYSPAQQEALRIYEEGALQGAKEIPDEIDEILKKFRQADASKQPTRAEVLRYRLWLEQKYRSPYTGEPISLSKLFTPAYQIEHVIPRARYFDDSLNNKVICEAEVNALKGSMLAYEFIKSDKPKIVTVSGNREVHILSVGAYTQFVADHYAQNPAKKRNLLMEDIPEDFINRQLNDSRYISRVVKSLLSHIVREEDEEADTSKHVIPCTGGVTARLKQDWGINDVWNRIVLPRFERMNEVDGSGRFTTVSQQGHRIPSMPLDLQRGFNKKRIDHRHHAMDAIVIACADRRIVNFLNNSNANHGEERYDLQRSVCYKQKSDNEGNYRWLVKKPWDTFTQDVYDVLSQIVVSFKQNLRVINRTRNHYQHIGADGKKVRDVQTKGDNWSIRKPMHKETIHGLVNLRKVKTVSIAEAMKNPTRIVDKSLKQKLIAMMSLDFTAKQAKAYFEAHKDEWPDVNPARIEVYYFTNETNDRYYATRKAVDTTFDEKRIQGAVTDTGIQQILLRHLSECQGNPEEAFSPEGLERMNRDLVRLNGGKSHQPIYKVRVYEMANKFAVGETGNKSAKFVEAAKGTNLYYAIYETEKVDKQTGEITLKRSYDTIPLNIVIQRLKQGLSAVPEDAEGRAPKYVLTPNSLVYLPTEEEVRTGNIQRPLRLDRIYKMVSATTSRSYFIKAEVAGSIWDKVEFTSMNKMERALTGEMIKETCIPLTVDRLGHIRLMD